MKHFKDDDYDAMKDYEFSLMHHEDDKTKDDYDKSIGGLHNDDGYPSYNDYEPTIRHFQDD